ncbi:hypothetical protein CSUI_007344 [Cystoisospora suis]|uniref:Transmembrane protein n=1 Tax=Cystoisospora suis TaxID=483139 RepID=A0A2C6KQE2_9APIC|nr:hypothetical protein CSUI_007344 [Cystoisospora suis]
MYFSLIFAFDFLYLLCLEMCIYRIWASNIGQWMEEILGRETDRKY